MAFHASFIQTETTIAKRAKFSKADDIYILARKRGITAVPNVHTTQYSLLLIDIIHFTLKKKAA